MEDALDSIPLKIRDGPGSSVNKLKAAGSSSLYRKIVPIIMLIVIEVISSLPSSIKENLFSPFLSSTAMAQEEKKTEISQLVDALGMEDEVSRLSAANVLRSRIDSLIEKIGKDYNAISELARINTALIKALGNTNERVRYHAADIFGKTIETLNLALNNNIPDVRYAVVESLGRAGVALSNDSLFSEYRQEGLLRIIIEALARSLEDKEAVVHNYAASYLEEIGRPAVNCLINILKNANPNLFARDAACRILGMIGKPAVQCLIDALKDNEDYIVRYYAV